MTGPERKSIDQLLTEARDRLQRLAPDQARDARDEGAVLVDIRPAAQRAAEGMIENALIIERNVLKW